MPPGRESLRFCHVVIVKKSGVRRNVSRYRFAGTQTACPLLYFGAGCARGKVDPLARRVGGWRTVCYDAAPWHIPELPLRRMLLTPLPSSNANQACTATLLRANFP